MDQIDLFLDTLIDAPIKDDRALMAYPFFSLAKRPRHEPIVYDDGVVTIEVSPGKRGIATIWDKDVLMYIATLLNDRMERGAEIDKKVLFNAYDLLRVTGRSTGKRAYELLFDSLFRLRSTTIVTTIRSDDTEERRGFGWIDTFRVVSRKDKNGNDVMAGIEITLCDWMYRAITKERRILTVNREYFKLRKGLERRLYELARKQCGYQERWVVSLEKLADRCGSQQKLRQFKADLKKIVDDDRLPDYHIAISFDPSERAAVKAFAGEKAWRWGSNRRVLVTFTPRRGSGKIDIIEPVDSIGTSPTLSRYIADD